MNHTRSFLFCCVLLCVHAKTVAQNYSPVDQGSVVKFVISNLGFDADGTFKGLQGTIDFDERNLSASSFHVTVNSNTINTNNNTRDRHLKGEDYFYSSKYSQIRLVSTKIGKSTTPGYFVFFGKLTIKEITHDIVFPFTAVPEEGAYRFKAEFRIRRRDFNIGGKNTLSNEVKVLLNVLTRKN